MNFSLIRNEHVGFTQFVRLKFQIANSIHMVHVQTWRPREKKIYMKLENICVTQWKHRIVLCACFGKHTTELNTDLTRVSNEPSSTPADPSTIVVRVHLTRKTARTRHTVLRPTTTTYGLYFRKDCGKSEMHCEFTHNFHNIIQSYSMQYLSPKYKPHLQYIRTRFQFNILKWFQLTLLLLLFGERDY